MGSHFDYDESPSTPRAGQCGFTRTHAKAKDSKLQLFCATSDEAARHCSHLKENGVITGIQFVTDEKGRKLAVPIDLKKYGSVLEDFCDGLISESRRKEKGNTARKDQSSPRKTRPATLMNYAVEVKPAARKEVEALPARAVARPHR